MSCWLDGPRSRARALASLYQITQGDPPALELPWASPEVESVLARALAKSPEGRFGSVLELAGACTRP